MSITKISGVYQADAGVLGELRYLAGKLRGTAQCSLCDITHGLTGKKGEFKRCEASLGIPVELVHLNERSPSLREFTQGKTPCVVGHTSTGFVMLLEPHALGALAGSVAKFERALHAALTHVSG